MAYAASVEHGVTETMVTATAAAGAAFEVKLNGVVDQDGVVGLAVGSGNVIAVVVTAQDGQTKQIYTVTVTRAGSSDARLSALSLSGVTLSPAFATGTTTYTASAGHGVTETTVAATAAAEAAYEVKLNGVVDQDGVVGLVVGSGNVIAVVVTAEDGETTQIYTVTVTRAGSADATLSLLSLSGVTLSPSFVSGTAAYTASVGHGVTETTVAATAVAGASYEVKLNGVVDQDGVVPLAVGAGNVIAVVVTAQDGESTQTYMVTVTRAGSADATLSALSLSGVTLSQSFASGTTVYTASVAHGVTETTVTAMASAGAAFEVKLNGVVDEDGIVGLVVGSGNVIAVVVTAQDGQTTKTYTVTVTRAGSSEANLSALSLSGVTLTPAFATGTTAYTASVGHRVTETTVTASASDANASVAVKVNGVADEDGVVVLAVGDGNVIAVVVTAQDGQTTQTYTVTVMRAGSSDATLSALSLSGVTLTPAFASGTVEYTASVANSVTETTVMATTAAGAAYEVKLNGVVDQDGVVGLAVGSGNVIAVVVTAQDGESSRTYSVTVTRAGSSDATLSALSLSEVTLSPAFAAGTTAYSASVANSVMETTVTAMAAAGAAYEVKLNGVVDQDGVVPLVVGSGNVIAVVVTAQDGEMMQTYSVTVTRAGSSEANLSALSLSGVTLTPAFVSGTTAYTASVGHGVTETAVTATAVAGAAYEVKLNGVVDEDGIVGLVAGSGNVIAVVVTAQDGETTRTYMVTVMRAGSSDATLSALSLSGVTLTPAFASGTTAYTASVGHGVTETTVTATAEAGAAYEIKLNGVVDKDGVVGLVVGSGNVIVVVVTAGDGETTQTYMVTVTRAGSSDARLSALSLSGMMLSPTFASGTAAYTATVGHGVTETTVTASVVAGAANEIKLNGIVDEDGIVPLAVGADNVITVIVTAQDGKTTQTYTVTVTRAGSADASLSDLSLMGEGGEVVALSPAFASGTTTYTAVVAHDLSAVTVSVSVVSAGSAYEIRIGGVVDQDGIVPLAVGSGNVITVTVTAQDGETTQTYFVTVTRGGSADATLSGLSLSGDGGKVFALSPAFAAGTTDYTAAVDHDVSAATVTVSVMSAGSAYEIRLNGVVDQDGVVALAVGAGNVIAVVVTAQDGESTQSYSVTVTRAGSTEASLSGLSLSRDGGEVIVLSPAFAPETMAYKAAVAHDVSAVTVTASVASAGSAYEVRLNGVVDQDGVVPLAVGAGNVIAVVVTAQDGESSQTYTVTVTRAGSADASLSSLLLSGVTLSPVFASGTTAYTAAAGHGVTETTVTVMVAAGAAYEVKLNGVVDQDGVAPLVVGSGNVIAVVVTAQDGQAKQTYTVTVTRAGSSDASLSALSLSGVTLTPAFAAGTTVYAATVAYDVSAVTVTASVASAGSAYEIRLNGVMDQDGVVGLAVGAGNVIAVVVTAQDGETTQTYFVTVTRGGSADATLSGLSLSGDGGKVFALSPAFAAGTTEYTATVVHDVSAVTVAVSVVSAGSAYEIRINGVVDQDGVVPLAVGAGNVIAVVVTAQDGESTQIYSVTVTRAGSSEASLSGLSLSGDGGAVVALSPAFASGTTAYTAEVAHDVSAVTVAVSVVSAGSAYEIRINGVVDQDGVVPLAVGAGNVIAVVVTAQDGESTQIYSVTVTRAGSADASLRTLSLMGDGREAVELLPAFASGTTAYTAEVAHDVSAMTVTASVANAGSAYEIRINGIVDQDGVVGLSVGSGNIIAVVVTAQDGESSQTYTVMVTRAGSADASLSALSLSGVTLMPAFASGTMTYTASVSNSVTETTVSASAVAGAAFDVKLNGVVDQDGVVPLAVGSGNVIAVEVAGWGVDTDVHGDCDAGRVFGGEPECAVVEWGDVDAGVCVGDEDVYGGSRP